jgi:dephospho-CoA kinase
MKVEGIASDPNIVIIDGKKFILERVTTKKIDKVEHADKIIFKEVDEEKIKEDTDLIAETLGGMVDSSELIKEILKEIPMNIVRKVAKRIRDKKPIKKQNGCIGFKVGEAYLPLIG